MHEGTEAQRRADWPRAQSPVSDRRASSDSQARHLRVAPWCGCRLRDLCSNPCSATHWLQDLTSLPGSPSLSFFICELGTAKLPTQGVTRI